MMEKFFEGKRSYWIINILAWSVFSFLMMGIMVIAGDPLNVGTRQLLIDTLFAIPIMVLSSHWIRNRLNYHRIFERLNWKTIGLIVIYSLIAALVAYSLSYIYYYVAYNLMGLTEAFKNTLFKSPLVISISILNTWIYFLGWSVIYVALKGIRELNKTREAQLKMQTNLREMQLNNLKGQINPHFMFNSLNNIRGLMLEDVEKSREMITRLSEVLRYSLTTSGEDAIPLEEELEMIEHYIKISKIQLEDRLEYVEHIDPNLFGITIPPMLIQILVENAVKHGISTLPNGGVIELNIEESDQNLAIQVSNTGQLKENQSSTKLGIKNVKERLQLLYGELASFQLYEQENEVIASIKIPLS